MFKPSSEKKSDDKKSDSKKPQHRDAGSLASPPYVVDHRKQTGPRVHRMNPDAFANWPGRNRSPFMD